MHERLGRTLKTQLNVKDDWRKKEPVHHLGPDMPLVVVTWPYLIDFANTVQRYERHEMNVANMPQFKLMAKIRADTDPDRLMTWCECGCCEHDLLFFSDRQYLEEHYSLPVSEARKTSLDEAKFVFPQLITRLFKPKRESRNIVSGLPCSP